MKTHLNHSTPVVMMAFLGLGGRKKLNHSHVHAFDTTHLVNKDWKLGKTAPSIVIFRFNDDHTGCEKAITSIVSGTYNEYPFTWSIEPHHSIRIKYQNLPSIVLKIFSCNGKTLEMNDILLNGAAHTDKTTFYHYE